MRYLFFDIECANCFDGTGKICEFGYLLTDESFKIIKKKNILINPESPFDPYVVKKILHSPKEEYLKNPNFSSFYPHIYALLSEKDQIVVGHTVESDAKYIFDECVRFSVKPPEFKYLDIRDVYKDMLKSQSSVSLGKMGEQLGVEFSGLLHSADTDAHLTMLVTKAVCDKEGLTLEEVVEKFPFAMGDINLIQRAYEDKRLNAKYIKECEDKGFLFITGERAELFNRYKKYAKPQKKKSSNKLNEKVVCISKNYEYVHYNQMLELAQLIINAGGTLTGSPTKCDIFIKYDVEIEPKRLLTCKRYETVKRTIRTGKIIEIKDFYEFLEFLETNEEKLSKGENINKSMLERCKLGLVYSEDQGSTIGDILKSKNMDN